MLTVREDAAMPTGDAMTGEYRLRQVAYVSTDLERVADQFDAVFGIKVAFRDPEIIKYGLKNIVMAAGSDFIEIVQPVVPDTSAGRYLARRGAEGGYMVILQAADALAHRTRLQSAGVEIVDTLDVPEHECTHFHPREFGGVLASIDATPGNLMWREADSDWFPAGKAWREVRTDAVAGLLSVEIQSSDAAATAGRWARMLDVRPAAGPDGPHIQVLRGASIRFVSPIDRFARGIAGLQLEMANPEDAIERARDAGLAVKDGLIEICGSLFRPSRAGPADVAATQS